MLRVYALWGRSNRILALLVFLWLLQVCLSAVAMTASEVVVLPPKFFGCIEAGSGSIWTPFWVMPLVSDTFVFILTILGTRNEGSNERKAMPMIERFRRDGVLYFVCIFGANLLNTCLFLAATEDLKSLGAPFSQLLTSVMVSRLVLNLRAPCRTHGGAGTSSHFQFVNTILGSLGEDIDNEEHHDSSSGSTANNTYELHSLKELSGERLAWFILELSVLLPQHKL